MTYKDSKCGTFVQNVLRVTCSLSSDFRAPKIISFYFFSENINAKHVLHERIPNVPHSSRLINYGDFNQTRYHIYKFNVPI